jgi:hypothetical protein
MQFSPWICPAHPDQVTRADRIQNVIQAISRIPIFHKDHALRDETIVRRGGTVDLQRSMTD